MNLALLPEIINEEKEYKVEEVMNHRKQGHSSQYTGKDMEINMINGLLKQDYYMQKRQLKTDGRGFQVETYKRGE